MGNIRFIVASIISVCVVLISCFGLLSISQEEEWDGDLNTGKEVLTCMAEEDLDSLLKYMSPEMVSTVEVNLEKNPLFQSGKDPKIQFLREENGYIEFIVLDGATPIYPKWSFRFKTVDGKISAYELYRLRTLDTRSDEYTEAF